MNRYLALALIVSLLFGMVFPGSAEEATTPGFLFEEDGYLLLRHILSLTPAERETISQSVNQKMNQLLWQGEYTEVSQKSRLLYLTALLEGDQQREARALLFDAWALSRRGKSEEALPKAQESYQLFQKIEEKEGMIHSLEVIIRVVENLNLWEEVPPLLEELDCLSQAVDSPYGRAVFFLNQGILALQARKYQEAKNHFQKVLSWQEQLENPEIIGLALNHLSWIELKQGHIPEAQAKFEEALSWAREHQARWLEFIVLLNQAELLTDYLFSPGEGWQNLMQCQKLAESMHLTYQKLWVWNNLSLVLSQFGDWGQAKATLEKAVDFQKKERLPRDLGLLINLGVVSLTLGQLNEAESYLEEALEVAQKEKDEETEANIWANLGVLAQRKGNYQLALQSYQKALAQFERLNLELKVADVLNNIGNINLLLGELPLAQESFGLALEIYQKRENLSGIALVQANLANVALEQGEVPKAQTLFSQARDNAQKIENSALLFYSLLGLGKTYLQLGEEAIAISYWENSVDILEANRSQFQTIKDRIAFSEENLSVYDFLIEALFEEGRIKEALQYSERLKARSFLDVVTVKTISVKPKHQQVLQLISDLKKEREFLLQKKSALQNQPPASVNPLLTKQLENKLEETEKELENLIDSLSSVSPEITSLVTVKPKAIAEIQKSIAGDTVIVDYYLLEDELLVFLLTSSSLQGVSLPINRKLLEENIIEVYHLISDDKAPIPYAKLENIASQIFLPLEPYLENKKFTVIIPHSSLCYLPFQTLCREGHYLVEEYIFSYAPSINTYFFSLARGGTEPKTFIGFGNPAFSNQSLPPLPASELEVKEIAKLFERKEIYLGKEATEAQLYQKAAGFDVVHLSTHAVADETRPLLSSIALAEDQMHDGVVLASEVFSLPLSAQCVVLSACQTALGKYSPTEGLVGFTRSFFYAGTPTLIASLWSVFDRSTMELFVAFYQHWLAGQSKAEAMQKAQKELAQRYPHPVFWAGFVIQGSEK